MIVSILTFGIAFVISVTLLFCFPALPLLSNVTLILASFPGLIGSLGQSGTVQPQLPFADVINKSELPIFLILYSWVAFSPCFMIPKSYSDSRISTIGWIISLLSFFNDWLFFTKSVLSLLLSFSTFCAASLQERK